MKQLFILLKTILWLMTLPSLYFAAHFWMGSQEAREYQVEHHPLEFFISRLAVTMLLGLIFMLFHWMVNRQLGKGINLPENLQWMEFGVMVVISCVLIWLSM